MNFKFPHGMMLLVMLSVICCTQSALGMLPSQLRRLAALAVRAGVRTTRIGSKPLIIKNPLNPASIRNIMTSQTPQTQCGRCIPQSPVSQSKCLSRSVFTPSEMLKAYKQYGHQRKAEGSSSGRSLALLAATVVTAAVATQSDEDKSKNRRQAFGKLEKLVEEIDFLEKQIDEFGSSLYLLFFADEKTKLKAQLLQLECDRMVEKFRRDLDTIAANIQQNIPESIDEQIRYFDHLQHDFDEEVEFPLWRDDDDEDYFKLHGKALEMYDIIKNFESALFYEYWIRKNEVEVKNLKDELGRQKKLTAEQAAAEDEQKRKQERELDAMVETMAKNLGLNDPRAWVQGSAGGPAYD